MAAEGHCQSLSGIPILSFNGAAAGWPRKDVSPRGKSLQYVTFNGAAAGWPRKACRLGTGMPFRRPFNGAAAGWPRKAIVPVRTDPRKFSLQWGRGRMAAEGSPRSSTPAWGRAASMGPRPDGRGRPFGVLTFSFGSSLQWGRGRMAAEGRVVGLVVAALAGFNGAAAGWPRKDHGARRAHRQHDRFNGAAAGWPRKGKYAQICSSAQTGFNGAAAGWPRKEHAGNSKGYGADASMGPRPDGRGRPYNDAAAAVVNTLQWGRGRMAAEGNRRARDKMTGRGLQWGRGRMAAEGCLLYVGAPSFAAASMGPRPDGRGRPRTPPT